jgi:hypothetical protein
VDGQEEVEAKELELQSLEVPLLLIEVVQKLFRS